MRSRPHLIVTDLSVAGAESTRKRRREPNRRIRLSQNRRDWSGISTFRFLAVPARFAMLDSKATSALRIAISHAVRIR